MKIFSMLLMALSARPCAAAEPAPRSQAPEGFWEYWGDGEAELAGYALTQPRYGEQRWGEAVLVFITESFTKKTRVKTDGEEASLTGSMRSPYWNQHNGGDERLREDLGLGAPSWLRSSL